MNIKQNKLPNLVLSYMSSINHQTSWEMIGKTSVKIVMKHECKPVISCTMGVQKIYASFHGLIMTA